MEEVISIRENIRERYKELLNNSLELIYVIDINGNFIDANDFALETFGYKREEIKDIMLKDLLDQEQTEKILNGVKEIIKNGRNQDYIEVKVKTKNGDTVYIETYGIPIKENGKVCAIIGIANDVTSRKHTELKLKESEAQFTSLLENSPDFIVTVDRNNIIQYINHIPQEFIKEPVIGRNLYEYLMPENQDMYKYSFKKVFETGIPLTIDVPGFAEAWYTTRFIPIKRGGDSDLVMLIVTNITDIKEAEKKLRDSEKKYRLISENAYDMITLINEKFEYEYINEKAHQDVLGYTKYELLGKSAIEKVHPDDVRKVIKKWREGIEKGEETSELRFRKKDGTYLWIEVRGKLFKDSDGVFRGILIARDINKRKLAEEKLRESEEKYRSILENMREGYIEVDFNGNFTFVNKRVSEFLGYSKDELYSMKMYQVIAHKDRENIIKKINKLIKGEVDQILIEYETIPKEGAHKYIEDSINLKYDSQGNKVGFFGVSRDITEKKEAKELIKKEREKLKELDLLKRDLTTQLSEKLKYPLSVISDVSEVLIESYQDQLDTNAQRLLELIREGGEKSTNMIERILDISKIESDKFKLKKQIENINEIVTECIHEAYENLKFREVGMTLIVKEEFFAEVDKIRFKQIFGYFLISSMKNTPKQESISISLEKKEDYAEIRVKSHEIEVKYDEYPFEMQYSDDIMKLHQGVLLREFDRDERTRTITIMLPMINWYDKLIHLYVIYHNGILLYDHPFVIERDPDDSLIISGGIIGMMSMLKEIIKGRSKNHVESINHGDRKIMFKLNSTEEVVFVLIVEEENPVIKKKLYELINDFEDYYREQIKDIKKACIMTHKWKGTSFLIKKHFKS